MEKFIVLAGIVAASAGFDSSGRYTSKLPPNLDDHGRYTSKQVVPKVDDRPELWLIKDPDGGCLPCDAAEKQLVMDDSKLPFKVIVKNGAPGWLKKELVSYPTFYWPIGSKTVRGCKDAVMTHGWVSTQHLIDTWRNNQTPKKALAVKVVSRPRVFFGSAWTEWWGGTSVSHLINVHHCPAWVVETYGGSQTALCRIHGAYHERGTCF